MKRHNRQSEQLLLNAEKMSELAVFFGYRDYYPGPRHQRGVEAGAAQPGPRSGGGLGHRPHLRRRGAAVQGNFRARQPRPEFLAGKSGPSTRYPRRGRAAGGLQPAVVGSHRLGHRRGFRLLPAGANGGRAWRGNHSRADSEGAGRRRGRARRPPWPSSRKKFRRWD